MMEYNQPFEALEHLQALRRYAHALARDPAQVDDLVQETLSRAYGRRDAFAGGGLRSWLLTILHNTFLNEARRHASERRRAEGLAVVAASHSAPAQEAAVRLRQIQAAFADLPTDQRAALHLVAVEGLSYQDAAEILGVPIGTLMSRLARARAALRALDAAPPKAVRDLRIVGGSDATP